MPYLEQTLQNIETMIPPRSLERLAEIYGGILVLGSLPDTPAAHQGLRYGDILTKVNGVRTFKVTDFFRARALDREAMALEFIRDGEYRTLTLQFRQGRRARLEDVRAYLQRSLPPRATPDTSPSNEPPPS